MTAVAEEGLRLAKCLACHARFVPTDGPCPRCASSSTESYLTGGIGTVLAATALEVPPPGWERPHQLALVEVEDGVRLLAIAPAPLPVVGQRVVVVADGPRYRLAEAPVVGGERGEGETPAAGTVRPPFEPPR